MTNFRRWLVFVLTTLFIFEFQIIAGQQPSDTLFVLANEIIAYHKQRILRSPFVVSIGGCPGAGKTTLANELRDALKCLGVSSVVLHLDDFNLSSEERKRLPTEWDFTHLHLEEAKDVLKQIVAGKMSIYKSTYDQITGKTGSETLDLENITVVLFEGLYATCSEEPINFLQFSDLSIFIDASRDDVWRWKEQRNATRHMPRNKEEFQRHMTAMLKEYDEHIAESQKNASVVISKTRDHEMSFAYNEMLSQLQ